MELKDFFDLVRTEIQESIAEKLSLGEEYPYAEVEFVERFVEHMKESGMTFSDSQICTHQGKIGNALIKISGYAFSEEAEQLDLFVANYKGTEELEEISKEELEDSTKKCFHFLTGSANGKLSKVLEKSSDPYQFASLVRDSFSSIDQIRIFVITDRTSRVKNFRPKEINGKTIKIEVMDIERLYRHTVAGTPRDEIVVNFKELCGNLLPCVYVPLNESDYSYALTVFPGNALYNLYEKYGARLLEANVRSFLNAKGKLNKVNSGIRKTLIEDPEHFLAYNNGLVIVTDNMIVDRTENGNYGILNLQGMQIVNGGQTTASLYFTKKKIKSIDYSKVFIPAKIINIEKNKYNESDINLNEELISNISKFANSQTAIKDDDLTANSSFHRAIEEIVSKLYCPDGVSQWFYERAAGSYNVLLAREGNTKARLRAIRERIPTSRKISKTQLAKYYNAWEGIPEIVALGSQKNFAYFIDKIQRNEEKEGFKPDLQWVKEIISKAILFKNVDRIVSNMKTPSKINVTTYTVSILSKKLNDSNIKMDFEKIWQNQGISESLKNIIEKFAQEVYKMMLLRGEGKLLSEWAKSKECWIDVQKGNYKIQNSAIPEFKR